MASPAAAPVAALIALPVAVASIVALSTVLRLHPFFSLLVPAVAFGALFVPLEASLDAFSAGVGRTTGGVGVIILCGSVIGAFLDRTDAVTSIAQSILRAVGDAHSLLAMALVGFITSIPVFADAAFIVLCPVINDVIRKGGHPAAHFALALGLATSHTMVPPTPGPVFAAAALHADLGLVAAAGSLVAVSGCIAATLFCFVVVPPTLTLDDVAHGGGERGTDAASPADVPADAAPSDANGGAAAAAAAGGGGTVQDRRLQRRRPPPPELWRALLPILLPMALIGVGSLSAALAPGASEVGLDSRGSGVVALLRFVGRAEIALCVGMAAAYAVLPLPSGRAELSIDGAVGAGVTSAAPIILITAAGGGFGGVIAATGVGATVAELLGGGGGGGGGGGEAAAGAAVGDGMAATVEPTAAEATETAAAAAAAAAAAGAFSILVPMALAAALKTAQGSGTVAITLTASLVAPLLPPSVVGFERALVVVAIGAGSLCVIHVNDSFFWVRSAAQPPPPPLPLSPPSR
jgi:GntP family gluconate:H+ symporter